MILMNAPKSALAALALFAAGIAPAAQAEEQEKIEIRHGDLDLSTAAGREELDRRIAVAAGRLCREAPRTGSRIADRAAQDACIANVRRQVQTRLAIAAAPSEASR